MVVLGGGAVSYERGTPVGEARDWYDGEMHAILSHSPFAGSNWVRVERVENSTGVVGVV